jgi:hypothetical protein
MIFSDSPELWVFPGRACNIKYEHAVFLGHNSPILLCSFASRPRPHVLAHRFPLWRCACSPAKHFCAGMLLPLP